MADVCEMLWDHMKANFGLASSLKDMLKRVSNFTGILEHWFQPCQVILYSDES